MEPWYGEEEKRAINEYLDSGGWLMEFKKTREFESQISQYVASPYVNVVTNGTVSLFIALSALGIKYGDEVIVPDYTMIATPNAVVLAGATPIFADIDASLTIDVQHVASLISPKTKAVIHVSINGRGGSLLELKKLCDEKGIYLIEDAAQSLGSFYNGKHLGTIGIIGSFSFRAPKIITTGTGGALVTSDETLYQKICRIKDFGRIKGGIDIHDDMGWNFKFTDLQAVIGIEQMKKLPYRVQRKRAMYQLYQKLLQDVSEVQFIPTPLEESTPWFMEVVVEKREELMKQLAAEKIETRVVYPAIHTQKIYSHIKDEFPNATQFTENGLWLPSANQLSDNEIEFICQKIRDFYA